MVAKQLQVQQHRKMTKKCNIEDTDYIIEAEAERFLLLSEKTFNGHQEKKLKVENLDCEDSVVIAFLTKVAKKIRAYILSDVSGSKAAKLLKIINSFFQSIFNSKQNGQK